MEFNFSEVHEAIARAIPEREALVFRDRRLTYAEMAERSRRLANYLLSCGLRVRRERSSLAGHESGQDHVALYLYNGNEYLEGMLGAFKARAAPINVDYRYGHEELLYLLENSRSRALLYHCAFADRVAAARERLPHLEVLIQVADGSGNALLPGAIDYEEALAASSAESPPVDPSPDDLYILYTGGTTGTPKAVLWRSADIFVAAMGGRKGGGVEFESLDEIIGGLVAGDSVRTLIGPPLMHAAAQCASFMMMTMGATLVLPGVVEALDAHDFLATVEREQCISFSIVADAFARPLLHQLDARTYDLSSLMVSGSGGASLSTTNKEALLERIPQATIMDAIGSSETGAQGTNPSTRAAGVSTGDFKPGPGACVVSADRSRVLHWPGARRPARRRGPGSNRQDALAAATLSGASNDGRPEADQSTHVGAADEVGWFAQTGRVPLGYLDDPEKTARTLPVIDGVRYAVAGDRACYRSDGSIEVLGHDSLTIDTGRAKVFAEEVEHALKQHPDVYDTVVAGRDR